MIRIARIFYLFVYFNGWISLAFALGYWVLSDIFSMAFHWSYLLLGLCCIQTAYGWDNLRDVEKDSFKWKKDCVPGKKSHYARMYKIYLGVCFLAGLFIAAVILRPIIPVLVVMSVLVVYYNQPHISKGFISIFKPLAVSLSWFFLLWALPHWLWGNGADFARGWIVLFPSLFTAVMLSDYRDRREDNLFIPTHFSLGYFVAVNLTVQVIMVAFAFLFWGHNWGILTLLTSLVNGLVLAAWPGNQKNIWGDVMVDSLGGLHICAAWLLIRGGTFLIK